MTSPQIDCHPNPSDPSHIIDTQQGWIVAYWAENFGVSRERLLEAVERVGCEVEMVRRELAIAAK